MEVQYGGNTISCTLQRTLILCQGIRQTNSHALRNETFCIDKCSVFEFALRLVGSFAQATQFSAIESILWQ